MEDMELWSAYTSQIIALTTVFAATLGMLRKRNVLRADDVKAVFQLAEKQLSDVARPAGSSLLAHMRMMAEAAAHDDDPGPASNPNQATSDFGS